MRMASRLYLLMGLLFPAVIFAQAKITGKVVESISKKSIQGVTVSIVGNNSHTVTNVNGDLCRPASQP